MGVALMWCSLLLAGWAIFSFFVFDTVEGWASLIATMSVLFAFQFLFLGIMGEYLGRLFEISQHRPLFLVSSSVGTGLTKQAQDLGGRAHERAINKQN
jgi:hypothetical protein